MPEQGEKWRQSDWMYETFLNSPELYVGMLRHRDRAVRADVDALLNIVTDRAGTFPSTALDIGCGLGQHALELARRGVDVVGIDIAPGYLTRARKQRSKVTTDGTVHFRRLDMRNLNVIKETFDIVTCLFTTFGYFGDETNVDVLRKMKNRLSNEGVCLVEVIDRDTLLAQFESVGIETTDWQTILEHRTFDTDRSRLKTTREVIHNSVPEEPPGKITHSDIKIYSPAELRDRFQLAGFNRVETIENPNSTALLTNDLQFLTVGE